MSIFVLWVDGKQHRLPPGAQVLTLPRLGLALVKSGSTVIAVSALGVDRRWASDDLVRLWQEWAS